MKRDSDVAVRRRTRRDWEEETLRPALRKAAERLPEFTTLSSRSEERRVGKECRL